MTVMLGYPWENYADALKTLKLGRWLLKKGYAYSMRPKLVIPYPGTILFEECKQKGWLRSLDWDDYDMKQPVMQIPIPDHKIMELVQGKRKFLFLKQALASIFKFRRGLQECTGQQSG